MKSERALEPGTVTDPTGRREAAVPATFIANRLGAYRAALTHLRAQRERSRGPAGSLPEIKAKVLADLAKRTNASPKDLQLAIFSKVTPSAVKLLRDALRQLEAEHLVVAEGHTTTRRYRRVVKPNGKAAGDEFEVAWSGSTKRPLTVQEPA